MPCITYDITYMVHGISYIACSWTAARTRACSFSHFRKILGVRGWGEGGGMIPCFWTSASPNAQARLFLHPNPKHWRSRLRTSSRAGMVTEWLALALSLLLCLRSADFVPAASMLRSFDRCSFVELQEHFEAMFWPETSANMCPIRSPFLFLQSVSPVRCCACKEVRLRM